MLFNSILLIVLGGRQNSEMVHKIPTLLCMLCITPSLNMGRTVDMTEFTPILRLFYVKVKGFCRYNCDLNSIDF